MACAALGPKGRGLHGSEDIERQKLNVFRMKLLGAEVHPVESGSRTLKDAINEALRDWVTNVRTTYYLLGSVVGPSPLSRDGQGLPERDRPRGEKRGSRRNGRRLPDAIVACVGGGSNSMGSFHAFVARQADVRLYGVEAGGTGAGKERRFPHRRKEGRPPRDAHLRPPGRERPGEEHREHLGRARLPRRGPLSTPS